MPLPIETPAPKASSLIKRFQQTIDNTDGPQALPLPKQRLSQDPDEIAQNRKSWSVASGGAPITINHVIWNSNQSHNGNNHRRSPSNSTTLPDRSFSAGRQTPVVDLETNLKHQRATSNRRSTPISIAPTPHRLSNPSDPTLPAHEPPNKSDPINRSDSNLNSLLAPSMDQSLDLSRLADLSKSDLAVQTPPTKHSSVIQLISSSSSSSSSSLHPSPEVQPPRKVKASISAESRAASARTRKQTNVTAPTAASLAKIKPSEGAPSVSSSAPRKAPAASPGPTNRAPQKSTGLESKSTSTRHPRTGSNGSSQPSKFENVRPATPSTSSALRKAAIAKTKVPPLPSIGLKAASAVDQQRKSTSLTQPAKTDRRVISVDQVKPTKTVKSDLSSASTSKPDKRPLQRARVASVATPISGVKKISDTKSPSPVRLAPKLKTSAGHSKSTDPKTIQSKAQTSTTRADSSGLKKSSKTPSSTATTSVAFPETQTTPDEDQRLSGSPHSNPSNQQIIEPADQTQVVKGDLQTTTSSIEEIQARNERCKDESGEKLEYDNEMSDLKEISKGSEPLDEGSIQLNQAQGVKQEVLVEQVMKGEEVGKFERDDVVLKKDEDNEHSGLKKPPRSPADSGHGMSSTDDEDQSKIEIDAATTNTDGEE